MRSEKDHFSDGVEEMEVGRIRINHFSAITRNVLWLSFLGCMLFSLGFIALLASNFTNRTSQRSTIDSEIAGAILMAIGGIGMIVGTLFFFFGTQNFLVSEGTVRFTSSRRPTTPSEQHLELRPIEDYRTATVDDFEPSPTVRL